jgi:hypothetical protein
VHRRLKAPSGRREDRLVEQRFKVAGLQEWSRLQRAPFGSSGRVLGALPYPTHTRYNAIFSQAELRLDSPRYASNQRICDARRSGARGTLTRLE